MIDIDKIYNEDCLEGMKRIADEAVDCVCTDIPYNEVNRADNGLRNLDKKSADIGLFDVAELTQTLCAKSKGSVYMFCGINQVSDIRRTMSECNLSTRLLIWEKTNPSPMNGDKIWLSGIECCVYGKKSGAVFNEFCKNTVFRYPSGDSNLHPTQKPLTLIRRLVLASTELGGVVLDPFIGSGTTAVAALMEKRHFIGFETNKEYFDIAQGRIDEIRRNPTLF